MVALMVDSAWAQDGLYSQRPRGSLPAQTNTPMTVRGWGRTSYPADIRRFFYWPTSRTQPFRVCVCSRACAYTHTCACTHTLTHRHTHTLGAWSITQWSQTMGQGDGVPDYQPLGPHRVLRLHPTGTLTLLMRSG